MSENIQSNPDSNAPPNESLRTINARIDEIERRQRKDEEDERSHNLNQLRVNTTIAIFTALLFVTSALSVVYLIRQTGIVADQKTTMDKTLLAMLTQTQVMQGQLEQMKGSSAQTDQLIASEKVSSDAARSASDTAGKELVIGNRPWVKIRHRIASPLTFDVGGRVGSPATLTIEDVIENVGNSVALNVGHWEEVIPMDPDPLHATKTATARARQYCDQHRHPHPNELQGEALFPHDPRVEFSATGVEMSRIQKSVIRDSTTLNGKAGFVVVGCIWYRFSFEPKSLPTHQTRFMYYLGVPQDGGFQPYITPTGIANELRLIDIPNGYTTD